jgi:hypothetical protein
MLSRMLSSWFLDRQWISGLLLRWIIRWCVSPCPLCTGHFFDTAIFLLITACAFDVGIHVQLPAAQSQNNPFILSKISLHPNNKSILRSISSPLGPLQRHFDPLASPALQYSSLHSQEQLALLLAQMVSPPVHQVIAVMC